MRTDMGGACRVLDALESRKWHDEAAYAAACMPARAAVLQMLLAMVNEEPPAVVAARAKAALDAVGILWETAARLEP
jgi:hypothetical protein